MAETAYIALGSNLGDRLAAIESAVRSLRATPGVTITTVSEVVESKPIGPACQNDYLNAAVRLETTLSPRRLLQRCQEIEAEHGRNRAEERRWGPRPLDLDLLMCGESVIDEPDLTVPHPLMHKRDFVLRPLAQIAPGALHPVLKVTVESLLSSLPAETAMEYAPDVSCSLGWLSR
ncbi:MAG: 2-amino-4-hydroxy-6-hydroxymethyldihydropteridine diphosphokinase [Phycisphaerales bacterium]|nr:MAG: 2-amino-4-hydroxy-6-hydroxymethyldihydropteridine diphosphokinase [Phycisphaerales bacterium]